jgi:hypothetical protein
MLNNSHSHDPGLSYGPLLSPTSHAAGEEGVFLDDLDVGAIVEVVTGHHTYRLENRGGGAVLLSGHPVYCPEPELMWLHGSVNDSHVIKVWFIGRGMRLELRHPTLGLVQTSRVREIHALTPAH